MKCSEEWLRSWINPPLSLEALADQFTMAGLEVGNIENGILEVDLTPNRGDCLSVLGLARECAALNGLTFTMPAINPVPPTIDDTIGIRISAPEACSYYIGRIIRNIDPHAKTPNWMQQRLTDSGVRVIHPVVDILNYVLFELGQPMHAFDLNKIEGSIDVRMARDKETLVLLDGQSKTLSNDCLVIADEAQALALAGIMGGESSMVSDNTQDVLLESAFFKPLALAGKGRRLGVFTDGMARFERGVDPTLALRAMERATALILEICGGNPGANLIAGDITSLAQKKTISLSYDEINELLGSTFSSSAVEQLLKRLDCEVTLEGLHDKSAPNWVVQIPTYRWDLTQSIDLIEEIARLGGYDNIPAHLPHMTAQFLPQSESVIAISRLKRMWADLGFQEVITYSFVDNEQQKLLFPEVTPVALLNPISQDLGVMRVSLWPSLLGVLRFNQNRQQMQMKIFEVGSRYAFSDNVTQRYEETPLLSGLLCGNAVPSGWRNRVHPVDFFTTKQHIENVWALSGHKNALVFEANDTLSCCHPGQCATILSDGKSVGMVGRLHPALEKACDVVGPVYLFELVLDAWRHCDVPEYQSVSRFPEIRRDIAMVVDENVEASRILDYVSSLAGDVVKKIDLFDVYQGKGIQPGRKSIAIGLILQHSSRTLIDHEADEIIHRLTEGLRKELDAVLRE